MDCGPRSSGGASELHFAVEQLVGLAGGFGDLTARLNRCLVRTVSFITSVIDTGVGEVIGQLPSGLVRGLRSKSKTIFNDSSIGFTVICRQRASCRLT